LLKGAIQRSKKKGLPEVSITVDDVMTLLTPGICPALGTPLTSGVKKSPTSVARKSPTSATLDQFYATSGYTTENVSVLSSRANTIKADASLSEVLRVAVWMFTKSTGRTASPDEIAQIAERTQSFWNMAFSKAA